MKKLQTAHMSTAQRGAAMFTALIMLIAVTLLSLASLGTSLMELRMSSNEEQGMLAFQTAQGAIDVVIDQDEKSTAATTKNFAVVGSLGYTKCTQNAQAPLKCQENSLVLEPAEMFPITPTSTGPVTQVGIERISDSGCPPRSKKLATSCSKQNAAVFKVDAVVNRIAMGRGKAGVSQGYLKLIPVLSQGGGTPPPSSGHN